MKTKFSSVKEMIDAGFYRTKQGHIKRLSPDIQIGIPDDDIILSPGEVNRLLSVIHIDDRRNHLLFGLMFRTGARVSQNLNVRVGDIDFCKKRVFIQRAKEGSSFYRYLDEGFLSEVSEYLKFYDLQKGNYLFSVYYKNRNILDHYISNKPISRRTVEYWLNKYAEKAGLQYSYIDDLGIRRHRIHNHTSKYTVASWIYSKCKDSLATAACVGNKTTSIMERVYIKISSGYRKEVVTKALEDFISSSNVEIIDLNSRHNNEIQKYENQISGRG